MLWTDRAQHGEYHQDNHPGYADIYEWQTTSRSIPLPLKQEFYLMHAVCASFPNHLTNFCGNDPSGTYTSRIDLEAAGKAKMYSMIREAWAIRPDRQWYFFYEPDTYSVWGNLNSSLPSYIINPAERGGGTEFAVG
ncbi:uncharacterized protein BCR38DRAFT_411728 [Pseudomassariella vexata]|uniref:Uncharacterized protein n=1 Tax=Pseudomassariella vexata TaxID=1141098 RepID=A0A1Y2DN49_9PEZI|nr:uncharacterized protein BCR38DRAFT_411728 [Pseudomassariella vexata]ORY60584.1 hypothetical protein BCR38DRAFT_411728 [Pseudomassariella vexata]